MKLEHIVALAVRLFSITIAIYVLRNSVSLVPYLQEQGLDNVSYGYLLLMAGLLLLSIYLWFFPLTVTSRLIAFKGDGAREVESATAQEIQIIGFSILGVYLLFNVISDIVYWVTILFIENRSSYMGSGLDADEISSILATGVELVFAFVLILGAPGVARVIKKLRYR